MSIGVFLNRPGEVPMSKNVAVNEPGASAKSSIRSLQAKLSTLAVPYAATGTFAGAIVVLYVLGFIH
jgi:hypothetical protein